MALDILSDGFVNACIDPSLNFYDGKCRILVEGQYVVNGALATPVVSDVPMLIPSTRNIDQMFTAGSILAESLKTVFKICPNGAEVYAVPRVDAGSSVKAVYTLTITGPATSDLRTFHYLVAPTAASSSRLSAGIEVRAGGQEDKVMIEDWFTARGRTVEVQANQLQASCDGLEKLSQEYEQAGLLRRRESIIAERNGRATGFALLEIASLGMNFSELTNSFTVHLMDDTDDETRRALAEAAKQRYAEFGRAQCIALEDGENLSAYEAAGFSKVKDYTCWTFHREHLFGMEQFFRALFARRRKDS